MMNEMNIGNNVDDGSEVLLLMNEPINHKDNVPSGAEFVQLTPTYGGQSFLMPMQENCDTMHVESLSDLLNGQTITLENGDLPMIEQDGQRYLVLPNVSVAQVISSSEIPISTVSCQSLPQVPNRSYNPPQTINSMPTMSAAYAPPTNVAMVSTVASSIAKQNNNTSISTVTTSIVPRFQQGHDNEASINNMLDIGRIFPSLCNNTHSSGSCNLRCVICDFNADNDLELDKHMDEHRKHLTDLLCKDSKERSIRKNPHKKRGSRRKKNTCRFFRSVASDSELKKGPFTCEICGLEISLINSFKKHMKDHINEKAYKCDVCSEAFNIQSNLTLHQALHTERQENGYQCPGCQKYFTRIASLKAHLSLHLEDETMICTECGDEFILKSDLNEHMRQHKIDMQRLLNQRNGNKDAAIGTNTTLNNVDYLFVSEARDSSDKEDMKKRSRKKSTMHKCMFCQKIFQKESQFKRHVLIHTGEKPYSCTLCDKSFNQAGALKMHMMMHSGNKPFTCPHCPQVYTQRGNLRLHIARVHKSINQYPCVECACVFKKLGSLNAHMTKYHKTLNQPEGQQAKKVNSDKQNLLSLLQDDLTTTEDGREGCDKEDGFQTTDVIQQLLSSLDDEENTDETLQVSSPSLMKDDQETDIVQQALQDSGVDPSTTANEKLVTTVTYEEIECEEVPLEEQAKDNNVIPLSSDTNGAGIDDNNGSDVNDKSKKSGVYMHTAGMNSNHTWRVRKVAGVRWHQCMFCIKEFKKPSDLVRHIRIHTQERPYKCSTCRKTFAVKSSLTSHEKIHLGCKPHKCQVCSKSFSTSGSLKVHLRLHTGARPFECDRCGQGFRTSGHLRNHILAHMRGTARKNFRKPKTDLTTLLPTPAQTAMHPPIRIEEDGCASRPTNNSSDTSDRLHTCVLCNKCFKKSCHLKQHIRSHTGERPYHCTQCGKNFISSSILKSHMRVHTGHKPFQCMSCDQLFGSHHTLKRHMTIHSESRPYMCPYCQKTFKTNATCKKHIEIHRNDITQANIPDHESNLITNGALPHSTIDANALFRLTHLDTQVTEPTLHDQENQCMVNLGASEDTMDFNLNPALAQIDPNIIQDISQVASYKVSQPTTDETILEAMVENVTNRSENSVNEVENLLDNRLNEGRDLMEADVNFKCLGCSRIFELHSHLQRHEELERNSTNMFTCTICCHAMECKQSQLSHIQSHTSSVVHWCPICFVSLSDIESLEVHKASHQPTKSYPCKTCQISCHSEAELQVHVKQCSANQNKKTIQKQKRSGFYLLSEEQSGILEKTDPTQTMTLSERVLLAAVAEKDMISPLQKHKGRGRFKDFESEPIHANICQYCPKSFRKPSDLTRHVRIHTGDKPYKCTVCEKSFAIKSTLTYHYRCHMQKKMFRCHICDILYSAKASLKVHMRLHTGGKPYKCPHCNVSFRTSGHRKNHMVTHFVHPNKSTQSVVTSSSIEATTDGRSTVGVHSTETVSTITSTDKTNSNISQQQQQQQQSVVWPEMNITVPMDSFLNTGYTQDADSVQLPIQLHSSNVQLSGGDEDNITLQIDPLLLQQTLHQESNSLNQQVVQLQPSIPTSGHNWAAPNVVIQPINQLCLQPMTEAGAQDSNAPPTEVTQGRQMQEINIAVPSAMAQQLLENPVVISGTPSNGEVGKNQEVTLNVNQAVIQAIQQLFSNMQNTNNNQTQGGQETTVTLHSDELVSGEGVFNIQPITVTNGMRQTTNEMEDIDSNNLDIQQKD